MPPFQVMVRGRALAAALAIPMLGGLLVGCGGSSSSDGSTTTTTEAETTAHAGRIDHQRSGLHDVVEPPGHPPPPPRRASPMPPRRSGPRPATGPARRCSRPCGSGRNDGFERIVFEFEGTSMPGYRIEWVDGPITADGSGEPVDVEGDAFLQIIMEPASGVDLSQPELRIVYDGPDRIATAGQTEVITDLVRTGDFEAVLTWVAGATQRAPFRVLALTEPTRLVVDIAT